MNKLNLTEEWYQNALKLEVDGEVSAGPPTFSFCERAMEAEAQQILAAETGGFETKPEDEAEQRFKRQHP
ncbi:MAG: hypothetical protein U0931_08190 [Vulcanimicrobiota bacterium]